MRPPRTDGAAPVHARSGPRRFAHDCRWRAEAGARLVMTVSAWTNGPGSSCSPGSTSDSSARRAPMVPVSATLRLGPRPASTPLIAQCDSAVRAVAGRPVFGYAAAVSAVGSLNHLRLSVRDPAVSERFYDALLAELGWVQIPRLDEGRAWERLDPTAGRQWLILTPIADEHRDAPPHDLFAPGFHHLAFNAPIATSPPRPQRASRRRRRHPRPAGRIRLQPRQGAISVNRTAP